MQDASRRDNFSGIVKNATVLGTAETPHWERWEDGLHLRTAYKNGEYPIVFKIELD